MDNNIKPLNANITRAVVDGKLYDVMTEEEYSSKVTTEENIAIKETYNNQEILLPVRHNYAGNNVTPGFYPCGPINFHIYPNNNNINQYIPQKLVNISNTTSMKDILESEEVLSRMVEPWITSPNSITELPISENDQPDMKCLKMAINAKKIDFDKYGTRFGNNFPNDKRQLKGESATLNIIKRFCANLDMEAILILRDKNPNVANPMNKEIAVSLTENLIYDNNEFSY